MNHIFTKFSSKTLWNSYKLVWKLKCTPGLPYLNPSYSWPFRVHCVILRPKFFHFLAVCSTIVVNCFSVWEILNPPLVTNLNGTSLAFCCRMPFAKHNQLCKTHGACLLKITKCETENLHLLALHRMFTCQCSTLQHFIFPYNFMFVSRLIFDDCRLS